MTEEQAKALKFRKMEKKYNCFVVPGRGVRR
jgi:hypothetical protein